ncbi:MAG: hypothetical protein CM15mP42_00200 [Methanobacteriota archaeon]|nr:MAG: hypothetical protein CM15mP42_00200 [Euryarchaeota archaeon]
MLTQLLIIETINYTFSDRGLVPFEVDDPDPVRADIIETMLNDAIFTKNLS